MKEFSDSLAPSGLEYLWLNMFNYFRKNICMYAFKLSKLNEKEHETATISNFLHLLTLHVPKFWFNILKTISLKIEKKTSIEEQSEGHALAQKTSESHLADWRKRIHKRCPIGSKRFQQLQSSCTWKNCLVNVIPTLWLPIQIGGIPGGIPGGIGRMLGGTIGIPVGTIGIPGGTIGIPGGTTGIPGGTIAIPGGTFGILGWKEPILAGKVGILGGAVGIFSKTLPHRTHLC